MLTFLAGKLVVLNAAGFSATDDAHGAALWVTDSTTLGSHVVKDILPGTSGSVSYHTALYNGLMYITCRGSYQLWQSDGTPAGTSLFTASNSINPVRFCSLDIGFS